MYEIFTRIPMKARRYAASLSYSPKYPNDPSPSPRSAGEEMCPLGACLKSMEEQGQLRAGYSVPVPSPQRVALALAAGNEDVLIEADHFMSDWDGGRVRSLRTAMGMKT